MPASDYSRDPSDWRIAERIRQGSEAAFETLFRRYCDPLCTFAEGFVETAPVAEDLVHDVFCDIWDRRADFEPKGAVKAYLYRAVRNKALNTIERRRVRREWVTEKKYDLTPSSMEATRAAEYRELQEAVKHAIVELTERQRTVYRLVRHQHLSYAEVATVLDISEKTVENHMGRALKRLRASLTTLFSMSS
jgi:RNA polymerase sigma-70 factor (ECF subfamily)